MGSYTKIEILHSFWTDKNGKNTALFVDGGSIKYMKFLMFTMDDPICKDQDR